MALSKDLAYYHAHDLAVAIIRRTENRNQHLTEHHARNVDDEFRKLAQSLGYRVEPITEQKEAAA